MPSDAVPHWFPYAFPFFFLGMWLAVPTVLGLISGWFTLQRIFPDDGRETSLLKLPRQSGSMGPGVALSGILTLRAYPSGLGIGIWRIFGPFQKPIKVPWHQIEAAPATSFFLPMVKLRLGIPSQGKLTISARSWERLANAVSQSSGRGTRPQRIPPVSRGAVARAMLLQWAVFTLLAATFFYMTSRFNGAGGGMPLAVCIAFPGIVLGIGQLIQYAKER